ncbi:hypothetical protein QBC44DRAFT_37011 [Cladorrhinum sp. PSN332]|nr:hypothetical protein QBC44DRAFT_37011 [Cladorrhinum sp. PSN332]
MAALQQAAPGLLVCLFFFPSYQLGWKWKIMERGLRANNRRQLCVRTYEEGGQVVGRKESLCFRIPYTACNSNQHAECVMNKTSSCLFRFPVIMVLAYPFFRPSNYSLSLSSSSSRISPYSGCYAYAVGRLNLRPYQAGE